MLAASSSQFDPGCVKTQKIVERREDFSEAERNQTRVAEFLRG
jgi:hypothetical protein